MKVKIKYYTPNPLELMGETAGLCWDSNPERSIAIAKHCFETGHGRISEFADIHLEISECSARLQRQIYTHVIGTSRIQQSTRYVNMIEFEYVTPPSIKNNEMANILYNKSMEMIQKSMLSLDRLNIPNEDYAMLLPLASHSKMVLKINVRALITMAHQRMCTRAYWEYRDLMNEIVKEIKGLDDEQWVYISNMLVPKCESLGYCTEDQTKTICRRKPTKEQVLNSNK